MRVTFRISAGEDFREVVVYLPDAGLRRTPDEVAEGGMFAVLRWMDALGVRPLVERCVGEGRGVSDAAP